jgi:3-oxoadipyl-CoA thiolase
MPEAYIVAALRTPVARYGGVLKDLRPDDLAAHVIRSLITRTGIDPAAIDDVFLGCTNQAGEDNRDVARMAVLLAGLPVTVPGVTVNRLCASGLEAINQAARAARSGDGDLFIAGGVESMTRAPFVFAKTNSAFERTPPQVYDTTIGWRFTNPAMVEMGHTLALGETAEEVATRHYVSREAQDAFALLSQQRAAAAIAAGRFADEIVAVPTPPTRKGGTPGSFSQDEHPRPDTTLDALAKLRPAFRSGGTVTAGNSSGVNDGAAGLLIATPAGLQRHGLRPLARIVSIGVAGVEPAVMGLGPIPATNIALARAGISVADLDLIELNEAFAAQAIPCISELGLDPERVNVNGGAIALGHPLGASGARLMTTLVHELRRRNGRYGLATMCVGVGQGVSTIIEAIYE